MTTDKVPYTLELFSGTGSFSRVMREKGYRTITVDNNKQFNPTYTWDLSKELDYDVWRTIINASFVWLSPPCTTLSMASGNKHWTIDRKPRTKQAIELLKIVRNIKKIIKLCDREDIPYVVENPRARMRWFLPEHNRFTVWYCQYGDIRAKPTDIWTNVVGFVPKTCKNNNPNCNHVKAPRGSKTGTQSMNITDRYKVPRLLIQELTKGFKVVRE